MKMYSLKCKDMGMPACDFVAMGESRQDVLDMHKEHMEKAHPKETKEMKETMSEEEIDEQMQENIVEKEEEM